SGELELVALRAAHGLPGKGGRARECVGRRLVGAEEEAAQILRRREGRRRGLTAGSRGRAGGDEEGDETCSGKAKEAHGCRLFVGTYPSFGLPRTGDKARSRASPAPRTSAAAPAP